MAEAAKIQGIEFQIRGSADEAVQSLDRLANSLAALKDVVKNGLGLSALAKEVKEFNDKLPSANGKKISSFASQMMDLAAAAELLEDNIGALAKAASAFERIASLKEIKIPKSVGDAIRNIGMAAEHISLDAVENLDQITRALQRLSNLNAESIRSLVGLRFPYVPEGAGASLLNFAKAAEKLTENQMARLAELVSLLERLKGVDLGGFNRKAEGLGKTKISLEMFQSGLKRAISGVGYAFQTLNKVFDKLFALVVRFASSALKMVVSGLKSLGSALLNVASFGLKTFASAFTSASSAIMHFGGSVLSKLTSGLKNAAVASANFVKNLALAPIKSITNSVSALTNKVQILINSLKRIAFYRVIRTIIKEIGEALKEGTENAYWYSKKVGDATKYISEAYDAFATASFMMKNQVGAAWATMFANLEPIIENIISIVTRAMEVVTMFMAKLGGKDTYLKAIRYAQDWAEETNEGAEAAKEWKNQLMGFDEINRLEEPSSGKKKTGKETPDYAAMFEETAIEAEISDLVERIKELWESQDWEGLGKLIGDTLDSIFPTAAKFEEYGVKLGTWINGAIQTAYYALKAINFGEWGNSVAAGVNAALAEIDFEIWGRTITRKLTAMIDFIIGLIQGLNWKSIGASIGGYLRGTVDEAAEWLSSYDWYSVGQNIQQNFNDLVNGLDFASISQSIGSFIVEAVNGAANFISGIDWGEAFDTIIGSLRDFADNFPVEDIREALSGLWVSISTAWADLMNSFAGWIRGINWENVGSSLFESLSNGVTKLVEIASTVPWGDIFKAIEETFAGLMTSFGTWLSTTNWTDVGNSFFDNLSMLLTTLKNMASTVPWSEIWTSIKTLIILGVGRFNEWLTTTDWENAANNFYSALGTLLGDIKELAGAIPWGSIWTTVKTFIVIGLADFREWLVTIDWVETGQKFAQSAMKLLGDLKKIVSEDIPWNEIWTAIQGFLTGVQLVLFPGTPTWDFSHVTAKEAGQKLVEALITLFAAITGFRLGGVMGGLIGTITGLKISAKISGLLFGQENGYTVSETTLADELLKPALNTVVGGILGFAFTGSGAGAFMGAKLALALTAGIELFKFAEGDSAKVELDTLEKAITSIGSALIGGFMGAKIGTLFGGPIGGLIGLTIGAVLGLVLTDIYFSGDAEINPNSRMAQELNGGGTTYTSSYLKDVDMTPAVDLANEVADTVNTQFTSRKPDIENTVATTVTSSVAEAIPDTKSKAEELANAVPDAFTDAQTGLTISLSDIAELVKGKLSEVNVSSIENGDQLYNNLTYLYSEIKGTADMAFSEMETNISNHLQNIVHDTYSKIQEIENYVSDLASSIRNSMDFEWKIPRPKIPKILVSYEYHDAGDGTELKVPVFDIDWYAKGGIVDGATLIGAGEMGKEAIIPLEQNTEWIGKVAHEMNAQLYGNEEEMNDELIDAVITGFDRVIRAMSNQDSGDIDMDSLARTITKYQRRQARAVG